MSSWVGLDHGIDTKSPYFIGWFIGVPASYYFFIGLFRALGWWDFKTRGGNRASDIMAFELVAGGCVTYLAIAGFVGNFGLFGFENQNELLKNDPFYGRSTFVENHLVYPMISYQGWNLLLCFFNKDLNDTVMKLHHFATGSLAYFGLFPYLHCKGLFYFGVAEITNVPLTGVDVFKYFPEMAKKYSFVNDFCRYSFALSFFLVRLILWPYYSYEFWKGSIDLLTSGKAHSNFVVGFFLGANLLLTAMQFLWGSKIFGFLFKGSKKDKAGKKEESKAH